jgi:hypothetical protein
LNRISKRYERHRRALESHQQAIRKASPRLEMARASNMECIAELWNGTRERQECIAFALKWHARAIKKASLSFGMARASDRERLAELWNGARER